MEIVTTVELTAMIEDSADLLLVNVLNEAMHNEAHIPGSFNVPLEEPEFEVRVAELVGDTSRKLIVYGAGPESDASRTAAELLEDAGFIDVSDYEGGVQEWTAAGYELESD